MLISGLGGIPPTADAGRQIATVPFPLILTEHYDEHFDYKTALLHVNVVFSSLTRISDALRLWTIRTL